MGILTLEGSGFGDFWHLGFVEFSVQGLVLEAVQGCRL